MEKQNELTNLSRIEHIKEETRRALEYSQTPRLPLSLAPRFRVEGITPMFLSPSSTLGPSYEEARKNDLDFREAILRSTNPYIQLSPPHILRAAIESDLKMLTPENRDVIIPRILGQLGDFASQVPDVKTVEELHKQVLIATFGEEYFKNSKGREHKGVKTHEK